MQLITNELGVIVAFAQEAKEYGFEIISIQIQYPDANIRHQGRDYRVEFEYQASNFRRHGHDPEFCDIIICWVNDWPDAPLPVIALSEDDWFDTDISVETRLRLERDYWKRKAEIAERYRPHYKEDQGDEDIEPDSRKAGRPRTEVNTEIVDYYIEHGPENVSGRMANEIFGLGYILHSRHREAAFELIEESKNLSESL